MKKLLNLLILITVFFTFIPIVKAASVPNVLTLDASIKNGVISAEGTTEDGVLAVAIMVYDEDGKELIAMQTTSVDDSNKYSDTIKVKKGNYIVKAVNYDGGNYVTKEVISPKEEKESNPNTGDNIGLYITLGAVALVGIIGMTIVLKKR